MSALATISKLSITYNASAGAALGPLDFDIVEGEKLAVIGESGSGKSTLALAIAGLLPTGTRIDGTIAWPGLAAADDGDHGGERLPENGRDIGFVFQEAAASLDPVMPVGRQIAEVVRTHRRLGWRAACREAEALLRRVRLPDPAAAMNAYPHQLSGGQKQRVAIAAAVAAGPRLLIADEATSALDTIVQAEIVMLIRRLVEENGMTLLFVSHDIALAAQLADRIAVFHDGEMVELGETAQVIGQPRHAYTRSLLAAHIGLDTEPLLGRAS